MSPPSNRAGLSVKPQARDKTPARRVPRINKSFAADYSPQVTTQRHTIRRRRSMSHRTYPSLESESCTYIRLVLYRGVHNKKILSLSPLRDSLLPPPLPYGSVSFYSDYNHSNTFSSCASDYVKAAALLHYRGQRLTTFQFDSYTFGSIVSTSTCNKLAHLPFVDDIGHQS